jgi:hypothetical protein
LQLFSYHFALRPSSGIVLRFRSRLRLGFKNPLDFRVQFKQFFLELFIFFSVDESLDELEDSSRRRLRGWRWAGGHHPWRDPPA